MLVSCALDAESNDNHIILNDYRMTSNDPSVEHQQVDVQCNDNRMTSNDHLTQPWLREDGPFEF